MAQCTGCTEDKERQVRTCTLIPEITPYSSNTHTHTILSLPIFSFSLHSPHSPPSRKMRSLHSWRLLLLTEQMGQSRQLEYHAATVATYTWARWGGGARHTHALPYWFPHLILCNELFGFHYSTNAVIKQGIVVCVHAQNHWQTLGKLANHTIA